MIVPVPILLDSLYNPFIPLALVLMVELAFQTWVDAIRDKCKYGKHILQSHPRLNQVLTQQENWFFN